MRVFEVESGRVDSLKEGEMSRGQEKWLTMLKF